MTAPIYDLVAAALYYVPALLWGCIAVDVGSYVRERRPRGTFPRVLLGLTLATALHYTTWTVLMLLRGHVQGPSWLRGGLMAMADASVIMIIALARHVAVGWSARTPAPTRAWLAVNYGLCAVMLLAAVPTDVIALRVSQESYVVFSMYLLILGIAIVGDFRRSAERGAWRPGVLWQARTADVVAIGVALVMIVAQQVIPAALGRTSIELLLAAKPSAASLAMYAVNAAAGLVFAIPVVVRSLGDVLPRFLSTLVATATVALVATGAGALTAAAGDPEISRLTTAAAVVVVVVVFMPAAAWLQPTLGRLVFRRGRLRWAELHRVIQTLPPERGVAECCRRLLAELARVMQLRGAAILLHDGTVERHGEFRMDDIARVWPRDGKGLPPGPLTLATFRDLPRPFADALTAADALIAVPVASLRRHWGTVFVTTDLRGANLSAEDDAALAATADQLALVLDAADLLVRTVAVERSLAHAEKLAAIGELAARFAHDIRNPVAAAHSLAQQLARDPTAPENAEHAGVILEELTRVERQVRDLLRFARREDYRFEPLDLAALVEATTVQLRSRCDGLGVRLAVAVPETALVRGDRERLRQVLVNLVENACDAVDEAAVRRVDVALRAVNGTVTLTVADTGPGVPPDVLPRLFEPFFTQKAHGTGLGLAIARRTIEAHGGRIEATAGGSGMTFRIELPAASTGGDVTAGTT